MKASPGQFGSEVTVSARRPSVGLQTEGLWVPFPVKGHVLSLSHGEDRD